MTFTDTESSTTATVNNSQESTTDVESQPEKLGSKNAKSEPLVQLSRWRLFWVMIGYFSNLLWMEGDASY